MPDDGLFPSTLEVLAAHADLVDVQLSRLGAERLHVETPSKDIDLQMAFARDDVETDSEVRRFRYRLTADVAHPEGTVSVESVAIYSISAEHEALLDDQQGMLDFGNHVALFAILPYLRQAISSLAMQVLGAPILLPILRRGELEFSVEAATD